MTLKSVTPVNDSFTYLTTSERLVEAAGVRIMPGPGVYDGMEAVGIVSVDPDGLGDTAAATVICGQTQSASGVFAVTGPTYVNARGIVSRSTPVFVASDGTWCDNCGRERVVWPVVMLGGSGPEPDPYPEEIYVSSAVAIGGTSVWEQPYGAGVLYGCYSDGSTDGGLRLMFSLDDLKPGASYRIEFEIVSQDGDLWIDWCDVQPFVTWSDGGSFSQVFTAPPAYDATYHFLDVNPPDYEEGEFQIAYVKGYRVD